VLAPVRTIRKIDAEGLPSDLGNSQDARPKRPLSVPAPSATITRFYVADTPPADLFATQPWRIARLGPRSAAFWSSNPARTWASPRTFEKISSIGACPRPIRPSQQQKPPKTKNRPACPKPGLPRAWDQHRSAKWFFKVASINPLHHESPSPTTTTLFFFPRSKATPGGRGSRGVEITPGRSEVVPR